MAAFSLTVVAPVRGYHVYIERWEAAIGDCLTFKREFGK